MNEIQRVNTSDLPVLYSTTGSMMAAYNRMPNPIEAADSIGGWLQQAGLVKSPGEGKILTLSAICRGVDIIQFCSEHSVVMGKVTRDYDLLLADLREAGGEFEWINTGDDGAEARLKIHWKDREYEYAFTMEMAQQAGLVKPESGWEKWPGNMLRSKCVRHGLKMYCPELIRGYTTPEDADYRGTQVFPEPDAESPEFKQRQKELQGMAAGVEVGPSGAPAELSDIAPRDNIDKLELADMERDRTVSTTSATSTNDVATPDQFKEMVDLATKLGMSRPQLAAGIKRAYGVEDMTKLKRFDADDSIRRMGALLEKKSQVAN